MRFGHKTLAVPGLLHLQVFFAAEQLHAVENHLLLDNVRRIAILVWHDAVHGFDQIDVTSKTGK